MVRNTSRRAWVLKRNGLVAFGPGVAVTLFVAVMWWGAGFTFTRFHLLALIVAAALLIISLLCLLASGKVQDAAAEAAETQTREVTEAFRQERIRMQKIAADARQVHEAEQLPLAEWDDEITNTPRAQPNSGARPELRRGPRPVRRSPTLIPTASDGHSQ